MTFFQVFGPGLAICALVVTIVCVSLVPAVLELLGPRMFGSRRRAQGPAREPSRLRRSLARWLTARPVAIVIGLACIAALAFGAAGARSAHLGVSFIPSLPETNPVRKAADAAGHAFVPGILAPTDVVLEQRGVGDDRAALRLQSLIARQPGVATVLGPGLPLPPSAVPFLIARTGDAARFITILNHEPTTSEAIATLRRLQERVPSLLQQAGLPAGTHVSYGGETALSSETVHQLVGDLWRVGIVTAVVMFLLLAVFLRALLAPILLLAGAVLAFAGAFGLTALLLPPTVGGHEFVYYVPLVAAVLLVGLGSDYNVVIVGRIHEEARRRSLRASIAAAVPSAARARHDRRADDGGLLRAAGDRAAAPLPRAGDADDDRHPARRPLRAAGARPGDDRRGRAQGVVAEPPRRRHARNRARAQGGDRGSPGARDRGAGAG